MNDEPYISTDCADHSHTGCEDPECQCHCHNNKRFDDVIQKGRDMKVYVYTFKAKGGLPPEPYTLPILQLRRLIEHIDQPFRMYFREGRFEVFQKDLSTLGVVLVDIKVEEFNGVL
jgi:hypothetical protein